MFHIDLFKNTCETRGSEITVKVFCNRIQRGDFYNHSLT